MKILTLIACFMGLKYIYCANILYVAPLPSLSHHIWNRALALALVERGHNITMIGHNSEKTKTKNFNIILFEGVYNVLYNTYNYEEKANRYPIMWINDFYKYQDLVCKLDFETEGLKILMNYPKDSFDAILFDATCGLCLYPIIDHFSVPVIAVTPFLLPNYLSNAMGNHWYTSYMPHYGIAATNRMCFIDRVASFFFKHLELFIRNYYYMEKFQNYANAYFGNKIRFLEEYEKDFTLLLSNTDHILDFPVALPPNIIPVGGLHISSVKRLPNELEEIMNNATEGVILFCLGTNVRSDLLQKETRETIIEVFGKLKQTILWKFETELEGLPKNIIIKKWLPQNNILGHPNTKMFISHGGALSIQEAMYHGIPVLGIPFFADQHNNVGKIVSRKLGLSLANNNIKRDIFNQLITNPVYSNNMKTISKKCRDQQQTPSERAVFWIEHVLKHGPLDEFALPTKDVNIFQVYSLDILAFVICILASFLLVIYKLLMCIFCTKSKKKEKIN